MSMKNSFLRKGEMRESDSETETLIQEYELSKILHVRGKRLRITINSTRKEERFIHFSTSIYSSSMYQAMRLEVLNKTQ